MKIVSKRIGPLFLLSILGMGPATALGATLDPELLRQAMQMPPAQREALMSQFGVQSSELQGLLLDGGVALDENDEPLGLRQDTSLRLRNQQQLLQQGLWQQPYANMGLFPALQTVEESVDLEELDPLLVPYERRYGLDFFSEAAGEFQRLDTLMVPDSYRLGFDDVLSVSLYGAASGQYELKVAADGQIVIPKLGPVSVFGLSIAEVAEIVKAKVETEVIGAKAAVALAKPRSVQIQVAGEVGAPGVYLVPGFASIVQILNAAGGVSDIGSLRKVALLKQTEKQEFDLYDQSAVSDLSTAVNLMSGDTVFVPPLFGAARIRGAVKRPGVYEILPDTTISDLLELAGGKAPAGDLRSIRIAGFDDLQGAYVAGTSRDAISLDRPLADGDVVYVPERARFVARSLQVRGAVRNEGQLPWTPGMRLSEIFDEPRKQLDLEAADLELGLIVRRGVFANELRFIPFSPKRLMLEGRTDADLEVLAQDIVVILPRLTTADLDQLKEAREFQELAARRQRGEELSAEEQVTLFRYENPEQFEDEEKRPVRTRFDYLSEYISNAQVGVGAGLSAKLVEVRGEVQLPGLYPFIETGRPADFIKLAGGAKESGDGERLLLLQQGKAGSLATAVVLDGGSLTLEGRVLPGDVLTLPKNADEAQRFEVEVAGKVLSPGRYVVPLGAKLSDLLSLAGGVSQEGDVRGAVFSRESLRKVEGELRRQYLTSIQERLVESALVGDERTADPSVLKYLENLDQAMSQDPLGRLQVNLAALAAGDRSEDILLQSGDRLIIPPRLDAVIVAGQVMQPGAFAFQEGFKLKDYVALAGGASAYGDVKAAYVVGPDGSVRPLLVDSSWLAVGGAASPLMPGDRVVVPLTANFVNRFSLTKDIVQLVYQSGIGLAAVIAAFN